MGYNITVTTAGNVIPEIWDPLIIQAYQASGMMSSLVTVTNEPGGRGDTLNIPIQPIRTPVAKAADTALTPVPSTQSKVQLVVDKHYADYALIERAAQGLSPYDLASTIGVAAAKGLARQVDTDLLSIVDTGVHDVIDASTTTIGTDAYWYLILDAIKEFWADNVSSDDIYFVVTPDAAMQLLKLDQVTNRDYNTAMPFPGAFASHYVGRVGPFWTFWSNQVETDDTYDYNMMFSKQNVLLNIALYETMRGQSLENVGEGIVTHVLYGCKAIQNAGVKIFKTLIGGYGG